MKTKDVLKTVGTFATKVFGVAGSLVAVGILIGKSSEHGGIVTYSETVDAIMNSSMWSADKSKAVKSLPMNATPKLYKAVIDVIESSMWSEDKLNLILDLCVKAEEA